MEKGLISVDRFFTNSQAYFLTHLHSDHTAGLSPSWSRGPLFLSPISAALLPSRFPGFNSSLLKPIPLHTTLPLSLSDTTLLVTAIDAHHCPGAVMFLFRGEFGCVLYTGDFRWEVTGERARVGREVLAGALGGRRVDVLYLDNTYCNPSVSFPTRDVAAQQVVDIISLHPEHDVIIGLDSLGKEELLLYISRALGTKIWVWPERLKTMHLLGFEDIFTTKTCLTRVRAVPRYSLTAKALESLNTVHPTIGIMPTGLPWGHWGSFGKCDSSLDSSLAEFYNGKGISTSGICARMFHRYAYSVPYSEHSCFSEILEFIKIIQPLKVSGIVSSSFCHISPRHYFGNLCGINHPSESLTETSESVEIGKNHAGLACRRGRILKAKKEKNKAARYIVRRSRIVLLRRQRRGIKISETDSASDLAA